MPRKQSKAARLKELIHEQEKDNQSKYFFSERITPRKQVLFANLPLRERTVFVLSFFMRRNEIALTLRLSPGSVSQYRRRAQAKLSDEERERFYRVRGGF